MATVAPVADHSLVDPAAEQQLNRTHQDRFPRPGFPGDDVETGPELQLGLLNQRKIRDFHIDKHAEKISPETLFFKPEAGRKDLKIPRTRLSFPRAGETGRERPGGPHVPCRTAIGGLRLYANFCGTPLTWSGICVIVSGIQFRSNSRKGLRVYEHMPLHRLLPPEGGRYGDRDRPARQRIYRHGTPGRGSRQDAARHERGPRLRLSGLLLQAQHVRSVVQRSAEADADPPAPSIPFRCDPRPPDLSDRIPRLEDERQARNSDRHDLPCRRRARRLAPAEKTGHEPPG